MTVIMEGAGNRFFAASLLSNHQYCTIDVAKTAYHLIDLVHDIGFAQQKELIDGLCSRHQLVFSRFVDDHETLFTQIIHE